MCVCVCCQGLSGAVELRSGVLGRNAQWAKTSLISRLPKYVAVQMLRFYWKPTPDSRDHAGVKCKMLRVGVCLPSHVHPVLWLSVCVSILPPQPISFPADNFDLYELCTPEIQAQLRAARDKCVSPTLCLHCSLRALVL